MNQTVNDHSHDQEEADETESAGSPGPDDQESGEQSQQYAEMTNEQSQSCMQDVVGRRSRGPSAPRGSFSGVLLTEWQTYMEAVRQQATARKGMMQRFKHVVQQNFSELLADCRQELDDELR